VTPPDDREGADLEGAALGADLDGALPTLLRDALGARTVGLRDGARLTVGALLGARAAGVLAGDRLPTELRLGARAEGVRLVLRLADDCRDVEDGARTVELRLGADPLTAPEGVRLAGARTLSRLGVDR
jgi:hypothetical protein